MLDYVFVNGMLDIGEARLAFDQADPSDPTLCASDHYGLSVTVSCSRASPGRLRR